ncbi:MAG: C1 family peptidase [Terracidiphilus sp.]
MAKEIKPEDRILNVVPSRNPENDWTFQTAVQADILAAPAEIPDSVDLREPWWKIEDPTAYGDCGGFTAAGAILRWHFVQKGMLPQNEHLSVRSIGVICMAAKQMSATMPAPSLEESATLRAAMDIARIYGCVLDSTPPFDPEKMCHEQVQAFFARASKYKIANYFSLRPPGASWDVTKNNWRMWLATKGPILTRLDVDATWDQASSTKGNLDVYKPDTVRGGHAVALVGYTPDRFICRNSWGVQWGDRGFGYASEAYAKATFTEAYGIIV